MPPTGDDHGPLRLGTIEISDAGIAECTPHRHHVVFLPRAGIERVTVHHGFTCERPVVSLVAAAVLLGFAGAMGWWTISAIARGYVFMRFLIAALFPGAIGVVLRWTVIRRGRYLRVDTDRGPRKLLVRGDTSRDSLDELLRLARSRFGYSADVSSLDG